MPHSNSSTFPRGLFFSAALTTVQLVNATNIKVAWTQVTGGAAAALVTFRRVSTGATYFTLNVPIGAVLVLPGFECTTSSAKLGLEIVADQAVGIVVAYEQLA